MLQHMDPFQWANWSASLLVAGTAGAAAVIYQFKADWRSSRWGWHLMAVTVAIGLFGLYTVLITIWPTGATATALRTARTVLQVAVAGMMVWRTRLILAAQRARDEIEPKH